MDLTDKQTIKSLLKSHGLWAKKSLGQNFLVNRNVLDKIVETANLSKEDMVLEIGPGLGVLTRELCKAAGKVLTIEKDGKIIEILKETTKDFNNLEIINQSVLDYQIPKMPYKVVANLPYNITSPVLRKFLESPNKPKEMTLMVQKEVAEKIEATPGDMSILAISVQFYSKPEIVEIISPTSFWPEPKVSSAIIKITNIEKKMPEIEDEKLFFRIVKAGFSEKRKMLKNSLAGSLRIGEEKAAEFLKKAGINPQIRAQELNLEDWRKIYEQSR